MKTDNNTFDTIGEVDGGSDIAAFEEAILKAKESHDVQTDNELKETLPEHNAQEHGVVATVNINDIALTEKGEITRTKFFEKMQVNKELYGDIALSSKEARSLALTFRNLTTGVNSVIPLKCTGEECPFSDVCWFVQNEKAPIGKPCIIEHQLLYYHTQRFIEEFDVDMHDHSEVMLVQELSELIVYEMRITKILGQAQNASMMGLKLKFSPDGEAIEEETIHWAWTLKEQIKNRRMKILSSLNATRQTKLALRKLVKPKDDEHISTLKSIKDLLSRFREETPYEEVK